MHCFAGCHTCLQTKPPKLLSQHLYWDNQKRQHAQGFLLCHCKVWQQEQLFLCNINKKATIKTKDYTNDEFLFFLSYLKSILFGECWLCVPKSEKGVNFQYISVTSAYMTSTMLTLPKSVFVDSWTRFRICGASRDSVLLAFTTSGGPSFGAMVAIYRN